MNIKCNSITKVYGKNNYGVRELSLEINSGEFLVIMGESGCGKSTFLRLLSGIYTPDAGELFLDGVPANNIPPQKRDCAMIFQDYSLYPNMTVYENIAFYLDKQVGLKPEQLEKRILPIIEFLGLKDVANVRPKFLSGGQQQRVALAKALVRRPKLVLLDEPLSNIDEKSRYNYLRLIKETKRLLPNSTFVYVTHNATEAKFLADRIAIMLDGKIVEVAPLNYLTKHPQVVDTMYFLGDGDVYQGRIESNVFYGTSEKGAIEKPLGEYELETLEQEDLSSVYLSKDQFLNGFDTIFNSKGKVISGLKQNILIPAKINNYVLSFQEQEITLSDLQKQRFIGQNGFVNIKFNINKLHKRKSYGDFSVNFKYLKTKFNVTIFEVEGKKVCLDGEYNQDITLYYNIEDLLLADKNGEHLLTKYAVYSNVAIGKVKKDRLYIGKSKFDVYAESGYYNVEIGLDAVISVTEDKRNSFLIKDCLAEETLGNKKLIYVIIDGFSNYVTLRVDASLDFLRQKNVRVLISTKEIKFLEE